MDHPDGSQTEIVADELLVTEDGSMYYLNGGRVVLAIQQPGSARYRPGDPIPTGRTVWKADD